MYSYQNCHGPICYHLVLLLRYTQTAKQNDSHIFLHSIFQLSNFFKSCSCFFQFWPHSDSLTSTGGKASSRKQTPYKVALQSSKLRSVCVPPSLPVITVASAGNAPFSICSVMLAGAPPGISPLEWVFQRRDAGGRGSPIVSGCSSGPSVWVWGPPQNSASDMHPECFLAHLATSTAHGLPAEACTPWKLPTSTSTAGASYPNSLCSPYTPCTTLVPSKFQWASGNPPTLQPISPLAHHLLPACIPGLPPASPAPAHQHLLGQAWLRYGPRTEMGTNRMERMKGTVN